MWGRTSIVVYLLTYLLGLVHQKKVSVPMLNEKPAGATMWGRTGTVVYLLTYLLY